jgi:hypothetical protein
VAAPAHPQPRPVAPVPHDSDDDSCDASEGFDLAGDGDGDDDLEDVAVLARAGSSADLPKGHEGESAACSGAADAASAGPAARAANSEASGVVAIAAAAAEDQPDLEDDAGVPKHMLQLCLPVFSLHTSGSMHAAASGLIGGWGLLGLSLASCTAQRSNLIRDSAKR